MSTPTYISLAGANPVATVLTNLQTAPAAVQAALNSQLNTSLQTRLTASLSATPLLAALVAKLPTVNIVASKDFTTQAFLKQQLDLLEANDPGMRQAVDTEIATVDATTTIGSLLNLSQPLEDHPLFAADAPKIAIASLISASPALAAANTQVQADFIDRLTNYQGTAQNFWTQISAVPEFTSLIPELQLTLQLGVLTADNAALVGLLFSQTKPGSLQDLTGISTAQWTQFLNTHVNGQPIPIPATIAGKTRDLQVTNYINSISSQLKSAFPTVYIAQSAAVQPTINVSLVNAVLTANPGLDPTKPLPANVNFKGIDQAAATTAMNALRQEITAFPTANYKDWLSGANFTNTTRQPVVNILNSAGFDIRTAPISVNQLPAWQQTPANLQGTVMTQLNSLQRLSRLTTDYPQMYALQASGKHSSFSVAQMPQAVFLNQFSVSLGGRSTAQQIYTKAINIYAQTSALTMRIKEDINGLTPAILGDIHTPLKQVLTNQVPNWSTLFGNPGTCKCSECRSVYGAAAYFVDLMQFLKNSGTASNSTTPLDVLQTRRPDLWYLKLNCENTNTELPFVDLVNEILETYIANNGTLPNQSNNTPDGATSNELIVTPEYITQSVYQKGGSLMAAVYPFILPFNRSLETARVYLGNLHTSLHHLMHTFNTGGSSNQLPIASEYLAISPEELAILNGNSAATLAQFYGYPAGTAEATLITPTSPVTTIPIQNAYLGLVENFLTATGLKYPELLQLLKTEFINPNQQITIVSPASVTDAQGNIIVVDPCDLTYMSFQNLYVSTQQTIKGPGGRPLPAEVVPGFLQKVYFFIRLWKKMGWKMIELDKIFRALSFDESALPILKIQSIAMFNALIQDLAHLKKLQTALSLSVTQLAAIWSNIDTDGRDSLYISLFQNKAVTNPVSAAFQLNYLAALPSASYPAAAYPPSVQTQLNYDKTNGILSFTGMMTDAQEQDLLNWAGTGNPAATLAVRNLYNQRWYTGTDLAAASPIAPSVNTILAALRISATDLTAIAVDAGLIVAGANLNSMATLIINGPITPGVSIQLTTSLKIINAVQLVHTTQLAGATDTPATIAAAITKLINSDNRLNGPGMSATVQGAIISLYSPAPTSTTTFSWSATQTSAAGVITQLTINPCPTLSLANLSTLYRYAILAGALGLSVPDLISLKALKGVNPFQAAGSPPVTAPLTQFVKAAGMVAAGNFTLGQLNYLYRALADPADGLPPTDTATDQLLATLAAGLLKIAAANVFSPDPTGVALRKKLSATLPADQVGSTMDLIAGTAVYTSNLAALPVGQTPASPVSFVSAITLTGTVTPTDIVTLTVLTGNPGVATRFSYTVAADSLISIAGGLAALINSGLPTASAVAAGTIITITSASAQPAYPVWTGSSATPAGAAGTETFSISNTLQCTGPLTDTDLANELASSTDINFTKAVNDLYNQAQNILTNNLYFLTPPVNYNSALASLPAGLVLPPIPPGQVSFVATATVGGTITAGDQLTLTVTSTALAPAAITLPAYPVTALDTPITIAANLTSLINANATLNGAMVTASASGATITFTMPGSLNPYPVWTAGFAPAGATETINFFTGVVSAGPMTNANRVQLLGLGGGAAFNTAVTSLYSQAWTASAQQLIDLSPTSTPDLRYNYVISSLLNYLQLTGSQSLVKQSLSQALAMDSALIALLLEGDPTAATPSLLPSQTLHAQPAMTDFLGGLLATYYSDKQFQTFMTSQIDPGINLDGTQTAFGSARWLGKIAAPVTDTYSFNLYIPPNAPAAAPIKLWVNDQLVIDTVDNPTINSPINLIAGDLYDFQLSLQNAPASAQFQLQWSNSTASMMTIPPAAFIPVGVYSTLSLLNRIALLVNGFSMKASDVQYLSAHSADFEGVNPGNKSSLAPFALSTLPQGVYSAPQPNIDAYAPAFFSQWERLCKLYQLKAGLPSGGNLGLFDIFQAAAESGSSSALTISATILQATGWDTKEFSILTGNQPNTGYSVQIGFGLFDTNFRNETSLLRLNKCFSLISRLGVSSQQLFIWGNAEPDPTQALYIQNSVKAKYDDTTWTQVGKSLNDKIRARSRDALIAYILSNAGTWNMQVDNDPVTTADQLYEFFLIDVQMGTCMLTSRIVQANAAIQLFVQRCLMNLEPLAPPAGFDQTQWNWMQNYRIWEANREVFLYPENYLVPALRDDMTQPFDDLLNSLLQNPITNDNVTQSYFNYLYSLNTVAQLEICGSFWQSDALTGAAVGALTGADNLNSGSINVLHVFGRTQGGQNQYYYRRFLSTDPTNQLTSGSWTPWETVNLQISGDQLIPVVWGGRLYLFWPTYSQTSAPGSQGTTSATASTPAPAAIDLAISLNWSEYQQGAWTSPQTAGATLNPLLYNPFPSTETIDYSKFIFYSSPVSTGSNPTPTMLAINAVDTAPSPAGTNILSNPNFITNGSGNAAPWTPAANGFSTFTGQNSVQVISDGNPVDYPNVTSESIPATAQQTWIASALLTQAEFVSFGAPPPSLLGLVKIQFFDSNNNSIANKTTSFKVTILASLPFGVSNQSVNQLMSISCTAPTGTVSVNMQVMIQSNSAAPDAFSSLYYTAASLSQAVPAGLGLFLIESTPTAGITTLAASFVTSAVPCPVEGGSYDDMWIEGTSPLLLNDGTLQPNLSPFINSSNYQLLFPQDQLIDLVYPGYNPYSINPFFYSDQQGTYFAVTENEYGRYLGINGRTQQGEPFNIRGQILSFYTHWHPFVTSFIQMLNWQGIPGLLALATQAQSNDGGVISGLELTYPSVNGASLALTSGILCAQSQVINIENPVLPATPNALPSYLYFTTAGGNQFYYSSSITAANPGDAFIGTVSISGITGPTSFQTNYQPSVNVDPPYPFQNVDFYGGAYSIYNWELFFHIPLMVATQLSQNQQYQDAMTWFNYIFNPTTSSTSPAPQRFWNFLPFAVDTEPGRIQDLLAALDTTSADPTIVAERNEVLNQILVYQNDPFSPFAIARLRPIAFMKKTVMAYLDNLIAWGDNLFSQNTRESINEATQLYVLAQQILGPRPQIIQQQGPVQDLTYNDVQAQIDGFSNPIVQLENAISFGSTGSANPNSSQLSGNGSLTTTYFCIPANDQLLGYWDTVADRLYKIRHCMNIQGQVEQLPLFAPPINPALLVQAAAAGVDLSSVLSDINAPAPNYRFSVMLQKALELCSEVRSLGGALLAALEKNDAEALSLLRATQETQMQQKIMLIKQIQVSEAGANLTALNDALAVTKIKQQYYQNLISSGLTAFETGQTAALGLSQAFKDLSQSTEQGGSALSLIPQFEIGVSGISSPVSTFSFGGQQLSTLAHMVAQSYAFAADNFSFAASLFSLLGQWDRRQQEWSFQLNTAGAELTQVTDQITAATFRVNITTTDQANQQIQINNAQAIQNFLTNKYTNQQLYTWMTSQVSAIYFQCYQMAYGLAKRAEACFRIELGLATSNFIQFGYWDSLKKGLLAGEGLYADLKRLEIAYLDQNNREYEISRSISLVLLDPVALITLKETGLCMVSLPEAFFDMDYPGHYMRRIRSLSLTIPCVTGPYINVNCTLTLVQNKTRIDNTLNPSYTEQPIAADPRFLYNFGATQSIATSSAQNDSGMFEVNFRDDRYLPFEGAGVISQWVLSVPPDCNDFDFESITDVVLNLKYTARDGGPALQNAARKTALLPLPIIQADPDDQPAAFPAKQPNLVRYFSLRHEFPTEWYSFLHPLPAATGQIMSMLLTNERFPFTYRGKPIKIAQTQLFLKFKAVYPPTIGSTSTPLADFTATANKLPVSLTPPAAGAAPGAGTLVSTPGPGSFDGVPYTSIPFSPAAAIAVVAPGQPNPWTLTIQSSDIGQLNANLQIPSKGTGGPFLNAETIDDLFFVCQYSAG